jgi:phage-related protein
MREDIPNSIRDLSIDLSPGAICLLYRLQLHGGEEILFTPMLDTTWQGEVFESLPCALSGVSENSDGEAVRPKFTIANPLGLFSNYVQEGVLEQAYLLQYQILKADLDADNSFCITRKWRVARPLSLNKTIVVLELRSPLDGQRFKLPARMFIPPEFPYVSID